jgi:hypothetical protein
MDTRAAANKFKVISLFLSGMGQTRVPMQWIAYDPSVRAFYEYPLFIEPNFFSF